MLVVIKWPHRAWILSWVVGRNLPAGAAVSGFYFIGIPAVKVFRCGIAMMRSILFVAFLVSIGKQRNLQLHLHSSLKFAFEFC